MLGKMKQDYEPMDVERKGNFKVLYSPEKMPDERENILIVPENSNGKWMLPIEDLGLNKKEDANIQKD